MLTQLKRDELASTCKPPASCKPQNITREWNDAVLPTQLGASKIPQVANNLGLRLRSTHRSRTFE